ncbi:integrin alpha-V isoform X2 [Patella vulgata]|uniref:integrin alpha-V isoform X2 n=2 Tax=Patella vulgata TaxID=6465 RepID=UPI0024A7BA4F|nr:integrin alpha-V isoform X2 [Patella vulgata]
MSSLSLSLGFSCFKSLKGVRMGSSSIGTMVLLCVLGIWTNLASGYNVDVDSPLIHAGETGSMFGYAVSQHIDQATSWLLVGAPKGITSQPGVNRAGSVFRCRTDRIDYCQEIPFDSKGNNIRWDGSKYVDIEDKSDQWFGATVQSSGENGVIVACAPRYTYFSTTFDKREPVGTCFVAKASTTTYEEFSPCRTAVDRSWVSDQYHKQGYCQAGMSASFAANGEKLMITAVGSYYWQGQLYNYKIDEPDNVVKTNEGPATDDDSYMGYSSSVGDFDGDDIDDFIVGIPKAEQHLGKVAMFTQNFTNIANITGEQVGSFFGYALAVTDLDGDELDDVIVGAPFYSDYSSSTVYDTGRVYIYYQQTTNKKFKENRKDILEGSDSKSRFGSALSKLGDINYDGYKDLGVGAPYAGDEGRGAIYIYHGSIKGIITQVSQVVHAKDITTGLSTFGHSLSGGWDQDGNSYPDLLVGAYASDKAIFLRTRPVVRVVASLKIEPEMINLEKRSCSLVDDTRVACLNIYTCLEYNGIGVPNELYFDIEWTLDTLQQNKTLEEQRAYYLLSGLITRQNKTIKLTKQDTWCDPTFAYVKNEPRDKLTPIAVDFKFKLNEQPKKDTRDLVPILDQYIPQQVRHQAQILKHCGKDNVCIPDLVVNSFRVSAAHIIGSDSELEILVMVENRGENAFNSQLWVTLPHGVSYRNIHGIQAVVPVSCGSETIEDEILVICDLGNPLPSRAKTNFTLRVSPKEVNGSMDQLVFALNVNSSNIENFTDTVNNFASVSIPVTASADLQLYGKSTPELIIFNATEAKKYARENRRPTIEHLFELRNLGPSATKTTELNIYWPSHNDDGTLLLRLARKPVIQKGEGNCFTFFLSPSNYSSFQYDDNLNKNRDVDVILQESRSRSKREDAAREVKCTNRWCLIIRCIVGQMESNDNFLIKITGQLYTDSLISSGSAETLMLTSRATAQVTSVPYDLKNLDISLFSEATREVSTAVNPDNLVPRQRPIEIWIIAVSISAGLLVLLLIIILLWWCGFFKRRKPEDEGYMMANGAVISQGHGQQNY